MKFNLKRIVALLLVCAMLIDQSMIACGKELANAISNYNEDEKLAEELKTAKILLGGDGINGTSKVTRNEMVTLLVRMLGKEDEANKGEIKVPFKDVAGWALPYVSYAYNSKITKGTSETTFSGFDFVDANQAATFMLRTLGVPDSEYTWDKALSYMKEKGMISDDARISEDSTFNRYALNRLVKETLETNLYGKEETLLQSLINEGAVLQSDVDKTSLNQKAEKILDGKTPAGISGGGASGGGGGSSSGGGGGGGTVTPTPSKVLKSLSAVKGKVSYEYGEEITFDDLTVSAIYSDESAVITRDYLTNVDDVDLRAPGEHAVTVSFTEEGKTVTCPLVINVDGPKIEEKLYEITSSNNDGIIHTGEEVTLTLKSLDEKFLIKGYVLSVYDEKDETFIWGETRASSDEEFNIKFKVTDKDLKGIKVCLDFTMVDKRKQPYETFTEEQYYKIWNEEKEGGFLKNVVGRFLSIFTSKEKTNDSDDKEYNLNSEVLSIKKEDYPLDHYMSYSSTNSVMNDVYYGLLYFEDNMDMHEEFDEENPNAAIKHIEIDENITGISSGTFNGFISAYDLTLPKSLKRVEDGSFKGLASLVKIDFKGSKKTFLDLVSNYKDIDEDLGGVTVSCRDGEISYLDALSTPLSHFTYEKISDGQIEITGLKYHDTGKIKIEETYKTEDGKTVTVTSLADDAFNGENISAVWLPNSVEKIGNTTFVDCNHLNYLSIGYGEGKSKLKIDGSELVYAQEYSLFLKEIYFNGTKEEYLNIWHGFYPAFVLVKCQDGEIVKCGITYAFLENGTLTITPSRVGTESGGCHTKGIGTFFNKDEVTDIVFEEGIQTIAGGAFANYKNLRNVTFPSTLRNIGSGAFRDCPNLGVINYPDRACVSEDAFVGSVIDEVRVSAYTAGPFIWANKIKQLTITEGKLYKDSIFDCNTIKADKLYIEEGVSGFNAGKLDNLYVSEVIVDENNTEYDSKDGALFTEGLSSLIYYPRNSRQTEFTIPEETTLVSAWFENKYLRKLNIAKNVTFFDIELSDLSDVEINIDEENEWLKYEDGFILSKDGKDAVYMPLSAVNVKEMFEEAGVTLEQKYIDQIKTAICYYDIPNNLKSFSYFKRNCQGENVYIHEGIEPNSNIFLYLDEAEVMFYEGSEESLIDLMALVKDNLNPNMYIIHIDEKGNYSSICKVANYLVRKSGVVTDVTSNAIYIDDKVYESWDIKTKLYPGDEIEFILDEEGAIVYAEIVKFAKLSGKVTAISSSSKYITLQIRLDNMSAKAKFYFYNEYNPYSYDDFLGQKVSFDRYDYDKICNLQFTDHWDFVYVMLEGERADDEKEYTVYNRNIDGDNIFQSDKYTLETGEFYYIKTENDMIVDAKKQNSIRINFSKEDGIFFTNIKNGKIALSNKSSYTHSEDIFAIKNNSLDDGIYEDLSFTNMDYFDTYELDQIEDLSYCIRQLVVDEDGYVCAVIFEELK